mmetsp:Transcript_49167/g.87757  ORF Transcript_49167/g.87757 Transcript_49167/m.87757 type:complete len:83 (+) Transcript_49167:1080-1328(+)
MSDLGIWGWVLMTSFGWVHLGSRWIVPVGTLFFLLTSYWPLKVCHDKRHCSCHGCSTCSTAQPKLLVCLEAFQASSSSLASA